MQPVISQTDIEGLLGRSLSQVEADNFRLYLDIAVARIEDLLCIKLPSAIPADLQLLIARCFGVISSENLAIGNVGIASKEVEGFRVSFENSDSALSPMVAFVRNNSAIIDKYGECQAPIRSGRTGYDRIRYI